jgi:thymidylate synthase
MKRTSQATEFRYAAQHKPNQLIYGNGQTAVITGWTVKQAIAKHLQTSEYAVIGQLYSPTRGINLLIRNLLFNPHVRFLVVLNVTKEDKNAGASQCLLDFFRNGVEESVSDTGRKSWVIRSAIIGYIDIDIEIDVLEKLRHSLEVKEAKSITEAVNQVKHYAQQEAIDPWGVALEFPMATIKPTVLPGSRYGHRIEGKTIAETWVKIIHRIKTTGTIRPTGYDGKWQELIDLMAVVTDEPADFYFPEPNYLPIDRSFLQEYISQILDDSPEQEGVKYTYGQRLRSWFGRDQIQQVIDKLVADIDSARAVMSLWDAGKDDNDSPPCLNHIWVRIVDNELSLTATFRSNDMFSAWPANAMGLRELQRYICEAITQKYNHVLKMGPLITISQSAHIYDDCFENTENVITSQYAKICQQRDYADPAGSFVIYIQDDSIIVELMTPGSGEVVNCYSGKSASQLSRQIVADCPGLQVEHAIYLGSELQKAEIALSSKQELIYEQDKSLKINTYLGLAEKNNPKRET